LKLVKICYLWFFLLSNALKTDFKRGKRMFM